MTSFSQKNPTPTLELLRVCIIPVEPIKIGLCCSVPRVIKIAPRRVGRHGRRRVRGRGQRRGQRRRRDARRAARRRPRVRRVGEPPAAACGRDGDVAAGAARDAARGGARAAAPDHRRGAHAPVPTAAGLFGARRGGPCCGREIRGAREVRRRRRRRCDERGVGFGAGLATWSTPPAVENFVWLPVGI